jgi:hypothetical protein
MPITLLYLASNPKDTSRLDLKQDLEAIRRKIRSTEYRKQIRLVRCPDVSPDKFLDMLNQHYPQIVHFSGHGNADGQLMFTDKTGEAKPILPEALKMTFAAMDVAPTLVVLSACYTEAQAVAIRSVVSCVIGMRGEIGDEAARLFAATFYRALGFGQSVRTAYKQGLAMLAMEQIPEEHVPRLLLKRGEDASQLRLIWGSSGVDIIASTLRVSQETVALQPKMEAASAARRKAVALYYQKISQTLKEVIAALRVGQYPGGQCEMMRLYAEALPETVGDLVGAAKANRLSNLLVEAHNVEELLARLVDDPQRDEHLLELEKAQANFQVLSDSLLAQ